jgi:hypothetical protein
LVVLAAGACGDDAGEIDPTPPNPVLTLDPSRNVADLTDADLGQLCDWATAQLGGYGARPKCMAGDPVKVARTRAACVADTKKTARSCPATVEAHAACAGKVAKNPCAYVLFFESECKYFRDCLLSGPRAQGLLGTGSPWP